MMDFTLMIRLYYIMKVKDVNNIPNQLIFSLSKADFLTGGNVELYRCYGEQ